MGRPVAPDDGDAIARPQPKRQQAKRQRTEASSSSEPSAPSAARIREVYNSLEVVPARIVEEVVFDRISLEEHLEKP